MQPPPSRYVGRPRPRVQGWALARFYSALKLSGQYYDANNASQTFSSFLAGSDVDPYSRLDSASLHHIPSPQHISPNSGGGREFNGADDRGDVVSELG